MQEKGQLPGPVQRPTTPPSITEFTEHRTAPPGELNAPAPRRLGALLSLALLASSALGLVACTSQAARTAPFRVRPDSVEPGKLEGPFSGQVTDAASGDPVSGALIYATWTYQKGTGTPQATGFHETVVSTDANGRYQIDAVKGSAPGRLADFQLVIYKKGYVAYRSDRRFYDLGPRQDFAQLQNEVVLDRWRADLSHVQHLRYVGGGAALRALVAWEVEEAAAELSGDSRGTGPTMSSDFLAGLTEDRLIAAQLLGEAEIKAITGFDGRFESGPLNDEADTNTYSSQHFKALGQPELFDVAVRLWRLDEESAERRFTELVDSLPGVSEREDIGDRALLAIEGDIQGFAFMDKRRALVVLITCGKGQCKEAEQLIDIARKVYSNIEAVLPLEAK